MFNIFDAIVLIIVLGCGYLGFVTGILASLFYILSGFVGIWAAQEFSGMFGLNFYVYFFLGAGVVILAGVLIRRLLKAVFLGTFDRVIGAFLGIILGVAASIFIVVSFPQKISQKSHKAVLMSYTGSHAVPYLEKFFPQAELRMEKVKDSIKLPKLSKKLNAALPRGKKTDKEVQK